LNEKRTLTTVRSLTALKVVENSLDAVDVAVSPVIVGFASSYVRGMRDPIDSNDGHFIHDIEFLG
jgi:pyruvate/oxaloacetate carboxyltransferase